MKTDDLIDALARGGDAPPQQNLRVRLGLVLFAGCAIGAGLLAIVWGIRPDLGVSAVPVLLKIGFGAFAAAVCLPALVRLSRPGRPIGSGTVLIGSFAVLSGVVTLGALAQAGASGWVTAWTGNDFPWCLAIVPVLAFPTAILLACTVRDLAPTRLALTGALLGAVSGGVGAMAYALHCPVDSVAFVATWYPVAIAMCGGLGAIVGPRLLRW